VQRSRSLSCTPNKCTPIEDDGLSGSSGLSPAPVLPPESAAFRGLAGEVVRAIEPHTEADPIGLLDNVLVRFGAMVGSGAWARVGAATHPPALYIGNVGRSSRSRQDTAQVEVAYVMESADHGWSDLYQVTGFGSGEAFIKHAAGQPGAPILMIEPELGRLLTVAAREGTTVSHVLRMGYDYRRIKLRVRHKQYLAPAAPVSMIGHITEHELKDRHAGLRLVEIMNGFGIRILWTYVDRRRTIASPQEVPGHVLNPLIERLHRALVAARTVGPMPRTPEADRLWDAMYGEVLGDVTVPIIDALTARAEAQLLRLSMIYALLDEERAIHPQHLESAWEVWRYCRWSAQHIFVGAGTGDADVDRIIEVLEGGDELTGRDLDRMFGSRSVPEIRKRAIASGLVE
jgi:hypothetical protein